MQVIQAVAAFRVVTDGDGVKLADVNLPVLSKIRASAPLRGRLIMARINRSKTNRAKSAGVVACPSTP